MTSTIDLSGVLDKDWMSAMLVVPDLAITISVLTRNPNRADVETARIVAEALHAANQITHPLETAITAMLAKGTSE